MLLKLGKSLKKKRMQLTNKYTIGADKREDGYLEGNNKDKSVAL